MLPFNGWLREKTGRSVGVALAYRCTGVSHIETKEIVNGVEYPKVFEFKHWRLVKKTYFGFGQHFWHLKDMEGNPIAFPLKLEFEVWNRGEVHGLAFDYDTGDRLNFGGVTLACPQGEPKELGRGVAMEHAKNWYKSNLQGNWQLINILVGVLIGGAVFFILGQNAEGIAKALGNIKIGG
jgi:hypothetical protein